MLYYSSTHSNHKVYFYNKFVASSFVYIFHWKAVNNSTSLIPDKDRLLVQHSSCRMFGGISMFKFACITCLVKNY